jgi:hypothetical protein
VVPWVTQNSAKTGEGVDNLFHSLVEMILKERKIEKTEPSSNKCILM